MSGKPLIGSANYIWWEKDELGKGATATIYKCREKKTGDVYAVKVLSATKRPESTQQEDFVVMLPMEEEISERNFDALDGDRRKKAVEYVPGYGWIPGKFGPPPGIPKDIKEKFDRMSDKEYLSAVLKLTNPEIKSLMVAEAERRRTFAAHWPIETIVKANDCAKEGFYYTGVADQVRCAFCFLTVRNWERGDVPTLKHKGFFIYCKTRQEGPSDNIPVSDCGMSALQMTHQLSCAVGGDNGDGQLEDVSVGASAAQVAHCPAQATRH